MKRYCGLFFLVTLLLPLFSGCGKQSGPDKFMMFDDVEYIKKFPHTYRLSGGTVPDIDVIGITDFHVIDSMMAFSLKGSDTLWAFYSLPDYRLLGRCLTRGDGPGEFLQVPNVDFKSDFFKKDGRLSAVVYDFQKGRAMKLNVDSVLVSHRNQVSVLCDTLPPFLFNFICIDDSTFFCKEIDSTQTRQLRYIQRASGRSVPPVLDRLNRASVNKPMEDINIISTIAKMNHENGLIVEMPIGLNYINLYSLDGRTAKTICIGEEADDISHIEKLRFADQIYTFSELCVFDNFWGVVLIGEDNKTVQTSRKKHPSILLFDWEGKPVAELKMDRFMTSFDIDLINGTLYTFDVYTDEFYRYDISHILKELPQLSIK